MLSLFYAICVLSYRGAPDDLTHRDTACFVILCECSATRVRGKTIAIATAVQALVGIVMTIAIPYMINPDQANLRGKLGFFFGGLAALCLIWSYFRVPETKVNPEASSGTLHTNADTSLESNLRRARHHVRARRSDSRVQGLQAELR